MGEISGDFENAEKSQKIGRKLAKNWANFNANILTGEEIGRFLKFFSSGGFFSPSGDFWEKHLVSRTQK